MLAIPNGYGCVALNKYAIGSNVLYAYNSHQQNVFPDADGFEHACLGSLAILYTCSVDNTTCDAKQS